MIIIIVAGGSGSRMHSELPKQFLLLGGLPILTRTLKQAASALPEARIHLVLPQESKALWHTLCQQYPAPAHLIVPGGTTRAESVRAGLKGVEEGQIVIVHDAVRPLASRSLFQQAALEATSHGAVATTIPLKDSIRQKEANGGSHNVDRSQFLLMQTPQAFRASLFLSAYNSLDNPSLYTDCASLIEAGGTPIRLIEGEDTNLKITTPADMLIAEALLPMLAGR
jgi:2-C-methyl-D-erythritol 4-phosphate cytidylyltransferase